MRLTECHILPSLCCASEVLKMPVWGFIRAFVPLYLSQLLFSKTQQGMSGDLFVNLQLAVFKSVCFSAMKLSMQKQIENGVCFKFELPENHYGSLLRVSDLADLLHICCIVLEGATDVIFRFFFSELGRFSFF